MQIETLMKIIPNHPDVGRLYADLLSQYPDTLTLDVTNPEQPDIIFPGGRLPVPGLDSLPALIRTIYQK